MEVAVGRRLDIVGTAFPDVAVVVVVGKICVIVELDAFTIIVSERF